MTETTELQIDEPAEYQPPALPARTNPGGALALTPTAAIEALQAVRDFIGGALRPGTDFGTVPGCGSKQVLLLPGAQKILMFFNSYPDYSIQTRALDGDHAEFEVVCRAVSRATGAVVGMGVGLCSTAESKYRFRKGERVCPDCGAAAIIKGKEEYGGGWLCYRAKGGCGLKYRDGAPEIEQQDTGKVENTDVADMRNTCLKMAMKRALVQAAMTLGCMSDYFDQDLEERSGSAPRPSQRQSPNPTQRQNQHQAERRPPARPSARPQAAPAPAAATTSNGNDANGNGNHGGFAAVIGKALVQLARRHRPKNGAEADARRKSLIEYVAGRAIAGGHIDEREVVLHAAGRAPSIDQTKATEALAQFHATKPGWTEAAVREFLMEIEERTADAE